MSQVSLNIQNEQLQILNEELENYFENTIVPQLFVDANLILRKYTPPAMKQFSLSQFDIGKNIQELGGNIRYPTVIDNIQEVIVTGKSLEKEIQTLDSRWFQMNILPYKIRRENKTNGVIITFVDITNRILILKELEKLNLDYETFISSVFHDIRQPLSILALLGESLEDAFKNNDAQEFRDNIERLNRSVINMKLKLDEVNTLNKIKSEQSENERVNIENIFEDVTLVLKDEIYHNHVAISTEFNTSEINFSRKNLRSILYNLVSNAIKYRKLHVPVEILIKTEKADGHVLLSVQDNGLGIAREHHEMIFERYTRINNDVEGTGMGLYLVRTMLENNGGKIEIESSLDEGSIFKVYFKS